MSNYYLTHSGVKNMHWHQRRWQNKDGSLTDAGFIHYYGHPRIRKRRSQEEKKADDIKKSREAYLKEKARVEAGGKGRKKKYNIGSQYLNGSNDNDWREVTEYNDGWDNIAERMARTGEYSRSWSNSMSDVDVMSAVAREGRINPGYGSRGTTQNCAKCSSAMVLCEMGYPASAGRQTYPTYSGWEEYWFDGVDRKTAGLDDAFKDIASQPNGAYGVVCARYNNSGHAFNYKIKNGVPCFYDGQNGACFDNSNLKPEDNLVNVYRTYKFDVNADVTWTRMDQATPNWEHMAEDSVISERGWRGNHKVKNEKDGRIVDTW